MSPLPVVPMLPFGPVSAEFPGFVDLEIAEHCGTTRRNIQRWRTDGISVRSADELACRIGLHPMSLWGTDWTNAEAIVASMEEAADLVRVQRQRENAKVQGVRRRDRKREWARTRAGWRFMDARWRQWDHQQDRNATETA